VFSRLFTKASEFWEDREGCEPFTGAQQGRERQIRGKAFERDGWRYMVGEGVQSGITCSRARICSPHRHDGLWEYPLFQILDNSRTGIYPARRSGSNALPPLKLHIDVGVAMLDAVHPALENIAACAGSPAKSFYSRIWHQVAFAAGHACADGVRQSKEL
jgi:hypothetical protein